MLAFFVWSEEPKPLVNAPLFEPASKQAKERVLATRCFLSLRENKQQGQGATQTADRAPRKVTIIYKEIKSDKMTAWGHFRLVGTAERLPVRRCFLSLRENKQQGQRA